MLSSGLKTYIFAIGKNRFHELRLQTNTKSIESNGSNYISDDWKNVEPNHAIPLECVALCLNALDATSRAILVAYYYERQSMQDICERFGFNDEAEAKKMKYACLLKMKNVFEENISNL
jgi:DNA-directed RNA polymerase specialized sigma24 family protein